MSTLEQPGDNERLHLIGERELDLNLIESEILRIVMTLELKQAESFVPEAISGIPEIDIPRLIRRLPETSTCIQAKEVPELVHLLPERVEIRDVRSDEDRIQSDFSGSLQIEWDDGRRRAIDVDIVSGKGKLIIFDAGLFMVYAENTMAKFLSIAFFGM